MPHEAAATYTVKSVPFTSLKAAVEHALRVYAVPPVIVMRVPDEDGEGTRFAAAYTYDATYGYGVEPQDYH